MPSETDKLTDAINDLDVVENSLLPSVLQTHFSYTDKVSLKTIKTTTYPYSVIRTIRHLNKQKKPSTLYLKRITIPNKESIIVQQALLKEDNLLRKLNKEMSEETVELIATFPEQQTIVTKECLGTPTDLLLNPYRFWWQSSSQKQALRNNLPALCGDWLKRFHSLTEQKEQELASWHNYLSGEMIWRIRLLKELKSGYSKLFDDCSEQFTDELKQLEISGLTHSYHGDFAPHNIFYSDQKIKVIDFYGAREGHALMDLINFIASIATRSENLLYPHWRIRKFCEQFLNAYGIVPAFDPKLLALLLVLQSIKRLLVLAQYSTSGAVPSLIAHRAEQQQILYIENYQQQNEKALKTGPWRSLDLTLLQGKT